VVEVVGARESNTHPHTSLMTAGMVTHMLGSMSPRLPTISRFLHEMGCKPGTTTTTPRFVTSWLDWPQTWQGRNGAGATVEKGAGMVVDTGPDGVFGDVGKVVGKTDKSGLRVKVGVADGKEETDSLAVEGSRDGVGLLELGVVGGKGGTDK